MNPERKTSFEGFYRANFSRLINQLQGRKRLGFHDAEDIIQASFAELSSRWDDAESPAALLATIIHRQTIKHWERQPFAKDVVVTPIGEEARNLHSCDVDPAISAEHRDTLRYLAQELDLQPIEQNIIWGRAQGLTTTEIARRADTSTVRIRQVSKRLVQRAWFISVTASGLSADVSTDALANLGRLPLRQYQVMAMALAGHRPREIARRLGITANNARVNLSHARKALDAMEGKGLVQSHWFWAQG